MTTISRSRSERMIAGVLGGIADHLGWSPFRLRLAFVIVSVLSAGFPGMLVYIVLWFLMPDAREPGEFRDTL
jgi:phage shock protein C